MSTTATTHAAREHARAQAGQTAAARPVLPARDAPIVPEGVDREALTWAETVAGPGYTAKVLSRGTTLRLTDVDGDACAHVLLFRSDAPWERLNVADTVKIPWQAYLGAAHPLLSDQGRVLATLVSDTSAHHDALCGTTSLAACVARWGEGAAQSPTPAGRELFKLAAAKHGLEPRDLPPSLSFFRGMRVSEDGLVAPTGAAGPGAHVELRAELPLIVLIANVPHPLDPREEYVVSPLEVLAWRGAATAPADPQWTASPELERAYLNTTDDWEARS
ncbi:MAG: urea carboxylase-associated protein 2 [Solirubrobacterales bacterium]|nr:urea carboxylase-associated protein 2 [Solirubrobacterales bacterium]